MLASSHFMQDFFEKSEDENVMKLMLCFREVDEKVKMKMCQC